MLSYNFILELSIFSIKIGSKEQNTPSHTSLVHAWYGSAGGHSAGCGRHKGFKTLVSVRSPTACSLPVHKTLPGPLVDPVNIGHTKQKKTPNDHNQHYQFTFAFYTTNLYFEQQIRIVSTTNIIYSHLLFIPRICLLNNKSELFSTTRSL